MQGPGLGQGRSEGPGKGRLALSCQAVADALMASRGPGAGGPPPQGRQAPSGVPGNALLPFWAAMLSGARLPPKGSGEGTLSPLSPGPREIYPS